MARKKRFLDGFVPTKTDLNPENVVYRKGIERPNNEEIVKEIKKNEFKHNRVEIYMAGTIILAASTKLFGLELPLFVLLPTGAILGIAIYFLDKKIRAKLRGEK